MEQAHTGNRHVEGANSIPAPKSRSPRSRRDSGFAENAASSEHSSKRTMSQPPRPPSDTAQYSPRHDCSRPHTTTASSPRTTSPAPSKATSKSHRPLLGTQPHNTSSTTRTARPRLHTRPRSSISSGASSIVYSRPYAAEDPFEMHRACTALFTAPKSNVIPTTSAHASNEVLPLPQKALWWNYPSTRAKQYRDIDKEMRGFRGLWRRWAPKKWQKERRVGFYEMGNGSEESVRRYRIYLVDGKEEVHEKDGQRESE